MHTPVLLQQAIDGLNVKKDGFYIDATFGEGGHSLEIIKRGGKVLGIDLDNKQILKFKFEILNEKERKKLILKQGNYAEIETIAKENDFFPVDGILFDLGLSMEQFDNSGRGFSFKKPTEPLDMRIDPNQDVSADLIVNSYDEDELYEIFAKYSEELNSRAIAHALVNSRRFKKLKTVGDLLMIIKKTLKRDDERINRRIFQALRIAVNNELKNLKQALTGCLKILKQNGRLVIICFHSIEDRLVKIFIKENHLYQLNRKVIIGNQALSFERSARLRIISKNYTKFVEK